MSAPEVRPLELDGLLEIRPRRFGDERGFFSEVWRDDWLDELGLGVRFVQDNHSYSKSRGVLRGLHFQSRPPPRTSSSGWRAVRSSTWRSTFVPVRRRLDGGRDCPLGWGMEPVVHSQRVCSRVCDARGGDRGALQSSEPYSPAHDRAIRFDDPAVGIVWPVERASITVSEKDRTAPMLAEIEPKL